METVMELARSMDKVHALLFGMSFVCEDDPPPLTEEWGNGEL